ncbi:peroxisomal coenzyme A diphosphatase NUDT7 [uncultured Gammaproteobacteria bacterium]
MPTNHTDDDLTQTGLTETRLRHLLTAVEHDPERMRGDHDLNPGFHFPDAPRSASVLIGIVPRTEGPTLIFTRRTDHLHAHAGQISFPGGRAEAEDASAEATALREAEEEIGLSHQQVEIIGRLDTYSTRTGFRVTPVVALVRTPFELTPDPYEVAEVFEVPLAVFLAPNQPQRHGRMLLGAHRYFYAFPYRDYYIWGATAGMLVNLSQVLDRSICFPSPIPEPNR